MVKTPCFHCRGHGFDPWSGNEDPAYMPHSVDKKKAHNLSELSKIALIKIS